MAIARSKVVIIGIGNVGSALAHHIVINNICNDLILINRNRGKAWAEATDLNHAMGYSEERMLVTDGDYNDCKDADIVVLAVSAPYVEGMKRIDMLKSAPKIIQSIIPEVMKSGFNGIFIVITNPVDSIAYLVKKISGLPSSKVIGTGSSIDSARLRYSLANRIGVDPRSLEAFCMGEHGDSLMVPWSQVTIGAKKFLEIMEDNKQRLIDIDLEKVTREITDVSYNVMKNKGATTFGIASMTAHIIKAILNNENKVMPVSAMLNGEYGEWDVYAGVPAVLTSKGIQELFEYHLTEEEREQFKNSVARIRQANEIVMQGI